MLVVVQLEFVDKVRVLDVLDQPISGPGDALSADRILQSVQFLWETLKG